MTSILKAIGKGLLGRLLAYGVFGLGFWLLFQGFLRPSIPLGILGGLMIPAGMYLMVSARRWGKNPYTQVSDEAKEGEHVDSIDGSR